MNVSAMDTQGKPWVSFCMSTYKRPEFLKEALEGIARQTFRNFEVIVSDNDPECSGEKIVSSFNDPRFRYFSNDENLGMIRSFNKSIDRSTADYIVMITDDDPVYENFLSELNELYQQHKNYSVYAGFIKTKTTCRGCRNNHRRRFCG
ncbi:MAG: glycosyltransferase family 2 protein [Ferruginibacter sp.]